MLSMGCCLTSEYEATRWERDLDEDDEERRFGRKDGGWRWFG